MRYSRLSYIFIACLSVTVVSSVVAEDNSVSPATKKRSALAIYAPRPAYPFVAWRNEFSGSGVALLDIDKRTGFVTSATTLKSTGHRILDDAALKAFLQWRFMPGTLAKVRVPIRYTHPGFEPLPW
jgi:TonB family protein